MLFDFDGTLLDRYASVEKFIHSQYNRFIQYFDHIPQDKYTTRFIELDAHGYVWKDLVYQQLIKEFQITKISWKHLFNDYVDNFKDSCIPFPHLYTMLEELQKKEFRLGMITNGFGQFQMNNIEALGIKSYFDTILISEWEGCKKPYPTIFRRALMHLNVVARESIFVGDHPVNDIKAAQSVGMVAIWKKSDQFKHVEAEFVLEDLSHLPRLIEKIKKNGTRDRNGFNF